MMSGGGRRALMSGSQFADCLRQTGDLPRYLVESGRLVGVILHAAAGWSISETLSRVVVETDREVVVEPSSLLSLPVGAARLGKVTVGRAPRRRRTGDAGVALLRLPPLLRPRLDRMTSKLRRGRADILWTTSSPSVWRNVVVVGADRDQRRSAPRPDCPRHIIVICRVHARFGVDEVRRRRSANGGGRHWRTLHSQTDAHRQIAGLQRRCFVGGDRGNAPARAGMLPVQSRRTPRSSGALTPGRRSRAPEGRRPVRGPRVPGRYPAVPVGGAE